MRASRANSTSSLPSLPSLVTQGSFVSVERVSVYKRCMLSRLSRFFLATHHGLFGYWQEWEGTTVTNRRISVAFFDHLSAFVGND